METRIYYFGLNNDQVAKLNTQELKDTLLTKQLELTVHTTKTALITANKAYKDKYTQLFLIDQATKDFLDSKGKTNLSQGQYTHVINKLQDVQEVLEATYHLTGVREGPEDELEPVLEVESTPLVQLDPFGEPIKDTQLDSQPFKAQSLETIEEPSLLKEPRHNRQQEEVEQRFKMFIYKDTGSKGIEEDVSISDFEHSQKKMIQEVAELRFKLTEATQALSSVEAQYIGYTHPDQTQALLEQLNKLTILNTQLEEELVDLRVTGNPEVLNELATLKQDYSQLQEGYETLEENLALIKVERDTLNQSNQQMQTELVEQQTTLAQFEETVNAATHNTKDVLLSENIKLANNNRKLNKEVEKAIKEKASLQVQLETLLIKLQTSTGNVPVVQGAFPNVEVWFSLSDTGNQRFYEQVLTDSQFTVDKNLVIDLGTNSTLSQYIKLTNVKNPYKWLTEGQPLDKVYAGTQGLDAHLITSMAHPQPRWLYTNKVDWQTRLEELNQTRAIIYLGVLTNSDVYNFVRMLQTNNVQIPLHAILGDTTPSFNIDKMNLNGLQPRTIKFVGSRGIQYSNLTIALNYKRKEGGESVE